MNLNDISGKIIEGACKIDFPYGLDLERGSYQLIIITFTDGSRIRFRSGDHDGYDSFIDIEEG